MLGIYIHIPFCERKCNYCAFSSFACIDKEKDKYITSLLQEIENFDFKKFEFNSNLLCVDRTKTTSYDVDTIYIGGGTPSLLTIEDLTKIKGIGRWTAEMYLIFSLGREDILSKSDGTIKRTIKWMYNLSELPTSQDIKIYFEKWKGYETIVSTFLWKSIELDLVKNEFSKITI